MYGGAIHLAGVRAPNATLHFGSSGRKIGMFFLGSISDVTILQPLAPVSAKGIIVSYLVAAVRTVKLCICAICFLCVVHQLKVEVAVPLCIRSHDRPRRVAFPSDKSFPGESLPF